MTRTNRGSAQPRRAVEPLAFADSSAAAVVGVIAGEERRRRYGERITGGRSWLAYDSLELLPYLIGDPVETVVVDLVRWLPVEAAPVLRELRQRRPSLRVIGVYEPSAGALPELADLACAERNLAFVCDADERFDLLARPVAGAAGESPTACRLLLAQFLALAGDGLRASAIHLALAPSRRCSIPSLAAVQGCSEDALERRFADAGLLAPAGVRRLAVAAEGLWQVAALRWPADEVAPALGLGTGDSLGRMIKGVFGFGLTAARLMGAEGARRALAWIGPLALRDLVSLGGLPALARARFTVADTVQVAQDRGALIVSRQGLDAGVRLEDGGRELWERMAHGEPLSAIVDGLAGTGEVTARRLVHEALPTLRWMLRMRVVAPAGP